MGPVLRPVDQPVAGQPGRQPEFRLDQVGQAEHTAEAVRVRLDVGHEGHPRGVREPREKPVRPPMAVAFVRRCLVALRRCMWVLCLVRGLRTRPKQ